MTTNIAIDKTKDITNGVDVGQILNIISEIEKDPSYAKFQWRATNQWINGSLSRSRVKEFFAGNKEDKTRKKGFIIDADEPIFAAGQDSAPNSMEFLLHALGTCLTNTLVYHAAVNGIKIEAIESSYKGDMDVRGLFGLKDDVRKGFNKVTVNMHVKSDANEEELTKLALYSPVYDIVSQSLPVEFELNTY